MSKFDLLSGAGIPDMPEAAKEVITPKTPEMLNHTGYRQLQGLGPGELTEIIAACEHELQVGTEHLQREEV